MSVCWSWLWFWNWRSRFWWYLGERHHGVKSCLNSGFEKLACIVVQEKSPRNDRGKYNNGPGAKNQPIWAPTLYWINFYETLQIWDIWIFQTKRHYGRRRHFHRPHPCKTSSFIIKNCVRCPVLLLIFRSQSMDSVLIAYEIYESLSFCQYSVLLYSKVLSHKHLPATPKTTSKTPLRPNGQLIKKIAK